MSRMDWDVMVADLEEKRTAAAQEVSDIDAVIATVRQRANGTATPAPKSKAAPAHKNGRAKARSASRRGRTKMEPALLARVRKQYEAGVPISQIPEGKGHSSNWIYQLASDGHWKRPAKATPSRPNPGVAASPAAAAPVQQPAGTKLSGSVKCTDPECGAWTDYDPCRTCGVKLKRKGW